MFNKEDHWALRKFIENNLYVHQVSVTNRVRGCREGRETAAKKQGLS